jgi:putative ABC transport system permease protein
VKAYVEMGRAEGKKPFEQSGVRGVRLESLESGRPEMRQTLDRAEKFLNLVALLAALLSAVAVAIVARGFAAGTWTTARCCACWARASAPSPGYAFEFVLIGLFASALGVALGFAVHFVFVAMLGGLVETALPGRAFWPVLFGMGMGLTLLFAFGLPPVLQLAQVPPLRVIRRDVGNLKPASLLVLGVGMAGFAALLLAASSDLKLGASRSAALPARCWCSRGLSWAAVKLLRPASTRRPRRAGWCWPRGRSAPARPTRWCRPARWPSACWRWCCWCCCAPTSSPAGARPRRPTRPTASSST